MSDEFAVTTTCDTATKRGINSRSAATEAANTHVDLCDECEDGDVEITTTDGGPEVVEESTTSVVEDSGEDYSDDLPDQGPSVDEDPLVWMPDEFTDTIDGTVAINRKGFEVLAHHYNISCRTSVCEPLTNSERVVFKATAVDADGDEYTAFGSGGEERGDSGRPPVEMADTRAYKRAISRATGVGMVAVEELQEGFGGE